MKKFCFLALALTITVSLMTAPSIARNTRMALASQQPPALPEDAAAAYADYYNEKDEAKKYEKAKAFLEKFSTVDQYWKNGPQKFIQNYELRKIYAKCQDADKTFFGAGGANEANLNNFLSACDAWIGKTPVPDVVSTTRISLGTGFGVLAGFYKDTARGMSYTEKAIQMLTPTTPPDKWKPEEWASFRKENLGRLTQYQGLYKLRQSAPDHQAAIEFLTKAAEMKDGPAAKDPNTYLLRAEATTAIYTKLNAEYNALPDSEKTGEKGKALLNQIYPVVEKMANDYARVVALTEGKPDYKAIYEDAKTQTDQFVKFLNKDGKPEDLYKLFKGDISAPDAKIKTEESASTAPPTVTPVKGAKTAPVAAAGGTPTKAPAKAPAKAKAPPKKKK
jgi:hypothetical protein